MVAHVSNFGISKLLGEGDYYVTRTSRYNWLYGVGNISSLISNL